MDDKYANAMSGLEKALPHRRPIIMLSEELPEESPGVARARIDTSPRSMFFDAGLDGVPSCAALEFMAQTMALAVGRDRGRRGLDPAVGFVLGTRRMEVPAEGFLRRKRYVSRAECTYTDGEFASFDCSISEEGGPVVATAVLTAYQPSDLGEMEKAML